MRVSRLRTRKQVSVHADSMWTSESVTSLILHIVFVYVQYTNVKVTNYRQNRKNVPCSPPASIFGPVWAILFGLVSASGFLYFGPQSPYQTSDFFIAATVVYIVNVILTKIWYPAFFSQSKRVALIIAIFIVATNGSFLGLVIASDAWLVAGLYIPYVLWTMFAVVLNINWVLYGNGNSSNRRIYMKT